MIVQFLATAFIAGFAGIVVLGHALLIQALFAAKDHSSDVAENQAAPFGLTVPRSR